MTGMHAQVCTAFATVLDRIMQYEPEAVASTGQFTVKLLLTDSQAGCLIGRGGSVLHAMREASGVQIRILAPGEMPPGVSKWFTGHLAWEQLSTERVSNWALGSLP